MGIRSEYAVTEVISIILVIAIVTSAVTGILIWGVPYIEEKKAEAVASSALTQLISIDNVIENVISMGYNSSRYVNFLTDKGKISLGENISSDCDRLIIFYSLNSSFDFFVTDTDHDGRFDINVTDEPGSIIDGITYSFYTNITSQTPPEFSKTTISESSPIQNLLFPETGFDAVLMNITIPKGHLLLGQNPEIVVGRIWVLDLGHITYEITTNKNVYKLIFENEGVIQSNGDSSYLMHEPKIIERGQSYVFKILQLKTDDVSAYAAGNANYRLTFKFINTSVLESSTYVPRYIRIWTYGEYNDSWSRFFNLSLNYAQYQGEPDLLCLRGDKNFTIIQNLLDMDLDVIG